jgi:hypothetical protein
MPEATRVVQHIPEGPTLASSLVPVVDTIRQLYSQFGMRSYCVYLVHVAWSGQRRGEGEQVELSRVEILPTPQVQDMGATGLNLPAFGLTEGGGISVEQISCRYTEDDLLGKTPDLQDPAFPATGWVNREFFWEVVENRPSDPAPVRRRYVPDAVPMLTRDIFQWKIHLTKQDYNNDRRGGSSRRGP